MKTPQSNWISLSDALKSAGDLSARYVFGADVSVNWGDLVHESVLDARGEELAGRSVLIATVDQLKAALALIELDGLASRVVLYPPDLPLDHLQYVIDTAGADAIVTDRPSLGLDSPRLRYFMPCSRNIVPASYDRSAQRPTEWVLLTSGTTGRPKLVAHNLATLAGAIEPHPGSTGGLVWSTFYDIRRYGGLQIFLRAVLTGNSLVLTSPDESIADFLARAGAQGVTHISGTPSHWRRALMSPSAHLIAPDYVRLSGEIADQGVINQLHAAYPKARISHAFATTEAGVVFDVPDGAMGFPARTIATTPGVEMKIENGSLRVRSNRTALCYLGDGNLILKDADGFVDTGDMLELRQDRYYFVGRRDGMINVGGQKVYPEEVEAVINRHPDVHMSLVKTKKNPITGGLVVAEVVLKTGTQFGNGDVLKLQSDLMQLCRQTLPSHKVPASISFVPSLAVAESGKLVRRYA